MSTFSTYNTQLEAKIANTSEVFYDSETKVQAVNDAIEELLKKYDIPEMTKRSTLTFSALGIAAKPADYFRMVKLWDVDSSGIETSEYDYLENDLFDKLSSTSSYYWTEDYVVADTTRELLVRPIDSGELQVRYMKQASAVESSGVTDSGLSAIWDEAVALGAAKRLFQMANRWDEAREFERLQKEELAETYLSIKNPGGIKQNSRVKSRFERRSLLGGFLQSYNIRNS